MSIRRVPFDAEGDARADRLARKAQALREDLGDLVDELDRRRHEAAWRLLRPFAIAGAVGLCVLAATGWRRSRQVRRARQRRWGTR